MKKLFVFVIIGIFYTSISQAQFSRYIVRFKNKAGTPYALNNPLAYLSQRAIDRRTKNSIPIDSTDIPVVASYVAQIKNIPNVIVLNASKWLNAITISTTDANAITAINSLPFVQSTSALAARTNAPANKFDEYVTDQGSASTSRNAGTTGDHFDYGSSSFNEIHLHNGEFLHNIGLRGEGMQIAILDGGFFNYTSLKAFDSVNSKGQVLSTWDFISLNNSVVEDDAHGMQCFSTIAANIPGQFIGKAPKASFHLYRTEDASSEYPIEEFNWACGAERADSVGAEIISSSLGYGYGFNGGIPDYPYSDLNGDNTISARAADMAAKKGMLLFIAAGNAGNIAWHFITTPADADSVITVGAVNTAGTVGSFSSYGPSADGRIKPDLASVGVSAMVQTAGNSIGFGNGTSFACPNMAGLGTCLWQGFPEFSNMRIVQALKEASSIFTNPNNRIGYGIPDMKKAFSSLLQSFASSSTTVTGCFITLTWTSKDVSSMKYEIERKLPTENSYTKIGEVNPTNGNILTNHSYQFNNLLNTATGIVSYRIRQLIDTATGSFTAVYIDTAEVNINTTCAANSFDKVIVAPNPAAGLASLIVETSSAVNNLRIIIYNATGQKLMQLSQSKAPGATRIELPANRWAGGKYYIQVFDDTKEVGIAEFIKL